VNQREDPDDWFGGAAPDDEPARYRSDDWFHDVDAPARGRWPEGIDRRIVVAAVALVGLLIAILAAAGVFSSGGHHATAPPATVPTTAATTTAPAATTTRSSTPAAVPTAEVKPGDKGAQVKLLQRTLVRLGYLKGTADGVYGPGTEDATKRFQTANGLTADGVVGPATRRALARALRP
jgi:hypothetical protein